MTSGNGGPGGAVRVDDGGTTGDSTGDGSFTTPRACTNASTVYGFAWSTCSSASGAGGRCRPGTLTTARSKSRLVATTFATMVASSGRTGRSMTKICLTSATLDAFVRR